MFTILVGSERGKWIFGMSNNIGHQPSAKPGRGVLLTHICSQSLPLTSVVFIAAGNALSSCTLPMTLAMQMTLALLQELLMALRANDADGYKSWLALGIEELGRDVAGDVESDWMVPLLVEEERDRLMAWQLGVSL